MIFKNHGRNEGMALISIIVPVYKVEKYLHRCIDSILSQSFYDFELILINDGSPDECPKICDEYSRTDNRVVVLHQKNQGLSVARNVGLDWVFDNSDSQWITFVDSDDWLQINYLESLLKAVVENDVNVSACHYRKTNGEVKVVEKNFDIKLWKPEEFFVKYNLSAVVAGGKLYKKSCWENLRYPVGKLHEDEFTTYKILFACKEVAVIDAGLYFYFQNENGIMKSPWNIRRLDGLEAFDKQIAFFKSEGYIQAYAYAMKNYFLHACCQIENIEKSNIQNKKTLKRNIIIRLRKKIFENKGLPSYSKKHREWILAKIFPTTMKIIFKIRKFVWRIDECGCDD